MTNYEHYKEKINIFLDNGDDVAVKDNNLTTCSSISCSDCQFDTDNCQKDTYKWLSEEYTEPEEEIDWSKVPVDTPIMVRNSKEWRWIPRYFAKYEDGHTFTFMNGADSWSYDDDNNVAHWKYAKLAKPEDLKPQFHQENSLTKEELMSRLCECYKESCRESAYKEMLETLDNFWNSEIKDDKKQKIANMVMELLKMEE